MKAQMLAHPLKFERVFHFSWGVVGALALACLTVSLPAHAQAAGEYGAAAGVSAGTVSSRPQVFRPGGHSRPNSSRFLTKHTGPTPQQINRKWFAKEAGGKGAQLAIDATPPHSSIWIDGKFVGHSPLTLTLPAGKHQISLLGPRQQQAKREVDIASGKNQRLHVPLPEVYPSAVSIRVFGSQPH